MTGPRTRTHTSDPVDLRDVEPGQLWSCGSWIALTLQRSGTESSDMWRALVLLGPEMTQRPYVGTVDVFPIAHPHSSWYKL
jgi:hypothetical protein